MEERSEEQGISRPLGVEKGGEGGPPAQLTGERYLTLLHDPDTGRSYILRHGNDDTEGAEIPEGTEFYEYASADLAQRAYEQFLEESRSAGELMEEDSTDDIGDFETSG